MRSALAYGLAIAADALDTGMRIAQPHDWPQVAIEQDASRSAAVDRPVLGGERAELELTDRLRSLSMTRRPARAIFRGPAIPPDELAHPYLWPVASIFSRWLGREAFHAGAVIVGGGAWALLGPKEAGKSSLLAAHAARGGGVLTDDLVVVDGDRAFAGPRWLDLRAPLPGGDAELTPTRSGTRLRMALGAIEPSVPLLGWVFLGWGDRTELRRTRASTTLSRLARWRAWGSLASDESHLLSLAGLPAYDLTRPREWSSLEESLESLQSASAA
jgi:hypothetical protein